MFTVLNLRLQLFYLDAYYEKLVNDSGDMDVDLDPVIFTYFRVMIPIS